MTPQRWLVVLDPLPGLQPAHDTSVALMEAAQQRGHEVWAATIADLAVGPTGRPAARARRVRIAPIRLAGTTWVAPEQWYEADEPRWLELDEVDAVLMRTDPPVDAAYLTATYLLDLADRSRTLLVNDPRGLREVNEKLFTLRFPELCPRTRVLADPGEIARLVRLEGTKVLKPTDLMGGSGVLLLRAEDDNLPSLLHSSTEGGRRHVIVQDHLSASVEGDRRVIVVDGEPVGAVRRLAPAGEFRCNMAAGGRVETDSVTPRDKEICQALAPEMARLGIVLAGIDVIGDQLTEVNVTSPTCVREIDALSGSRLAHQIAERLEAAAAAGRR